MTQEQQIVISGAVTGFTLLIHGAIDQRHKYETFEEMEKVNARLREAFVKEGLEGVISNGIITTHSMIRFKTDIAQEEEVPIEGYNLVGLAKGVAANKVICKCGQPLWRIGTIEEFKDEPEFVCDDCRKENERRGVGLAQIWKQRSEEELVRLLARRVEEFPMSARSRNGLKYRNIEHLMDLVQTTEQEILRTPDFGQKSLEEVKAILKSLNLVFGMKIVWKTDLTEASLRWPTDEVAVSDYIGLVNSLGLK